MKTRIKQGLRAVGMAPLPKLDERLANLERVFRAPPLTRELVAAIKLISPQLDLNTSERARAHWEADQNGACWGEFEALEPLLRAMPRPAKVLEIGPGLGRSLVFFSKKLAWEDTEIHAYEGNGSETKYTVLGPRFEDSFCGSIEMLRHVLEWNGIEKLTIHDAKDARIAELPGPYDFLYSFYSIGFHWSLEHFLDDVLRLMDDSSLAVFTVPAEFEPFPALEQVSYRTITWKTVWPKDRVLKLLVIGKTSLPAS